MPTHPDLTTVLLAYDRAANTSHLFPTVDPAAAGLVVTNAYAFSIACALDRGTRADIIWTIPYDMQQYLGHLNPFRIHDMSLSELDLMFRRLPRRPRYTNDAPRTLQDLTRIIVSECGGDASKIWTGKRASEVNRTFRSIFGVGEGIANMAVLLIEKAWRIRFDDLDRPHMDIKPDVHTTRVLYRLGAAEGTSTWDAIEAARRLNPSFPGALDGALWLIGRGWCRPMAPDCNNCPVVACCARRI